MSFNYDGRCFRPVANSPTGQVSSETLFQYTQTGNLLTATYSGGSIRHGQMVGLVKSGGELEFCYHHVTNDGELRSGFCLSSPTVLHDGRIRLEESWYWTMPERTEGQSVVEEV